MIKIKELNLKPIKNELLVPESITEHSQESSEGTGQSKKRKIRFKNKVETINDIGGIEETSSTTEQDYQLSESEELFITDPFVRDLPSKNERSKLFIMIPVVLIPTFGILLICLALDAMTQNWVIDGDVPSWHLTSMKAFFFTLLNAPYETTNAAMVSITGSLTFIFGLNITILSVVIEFAAESFSDHVSLLIVKDKKVLSFLAFLLFSNSLGLWAYLSNGSYHSPRIIVVILNLMIDFQLVYLYPFLINLFTYIDGDFVISSTITEGLNSAIDAVNVQSLLGCHLSKSERKNLRKHQLDTLTSLDHLMDSAMSAIKKRKKTISSNIIDAMSSFLIHYFEFKNKLPKKWFVLSRKVQNTSDFLIMDSYISSLTEERRIIIEWKVFRHFQTLFNESIKFSNELSYHVVMNSRIVGESAAFFCDYSVVDLTMKFFHTYIRTALNNNNTRVVYNILFQYRLLAETLLNRKRVKKSSQHALGLRALKIAKYFRYYCSIVHGAKNYFLVEVIAQDIRVLCQNAISQTHFQPTKSAVGISKSKAIYRSIHNHILDVFLSLSEITANAIECQRPFVRASIILAAFYLKEKQTGFMLSLTNFLDKQFDHFLLVSVKDELSILSPEEYWEVTERGANFSFIHQTLIKKLDELFSMFQWYTNKESEFWVVQNAKTRDVNALKLQQEINNFASDIE